MVEISNPFEHSHVHVEDEEPFEPLDPAQQALADALSWAFFLLKLALIVVFVAYCSTGLFWVDEQERVVRLRFGKIVGDKVYEPGLHVGWPFPIEDRIKVPVKPITINIKQAFWFEMNEYDEGKLLDDLTHRPGPLKPERDGFLVTGDANIVHGRFQVTYVVEDPLMYVRTVGDQMTANRIVSNVAEQGIMWAVAQIRAEQFTKGQFNEEATKHRLQKILNEINAGIKIQYLTLTDPTVPLGVRRSYKFVVAAESERARLIEEARQKRATILNQTAGESHVPLFALIKEYTEARDVGSEADARFLLSEIEKAFDHGRMSASSGGAAIRGQAAQVISQARTYRTQTVEQFKAEAETFRKLHNQYQNTPRLVLSQLWQNARQEIFAGDVETFYTDGNLMIVTNPDPNIARDRELSRIRESKESVEQDPRQ